jgi:hypothetical protein
MEIAYLREPKFRQMELDSIQVRLDEEAKRQRKASSIAGSSGSAPRTQRAPSTPEERFAAMVDEIRAAQGGA